MEQQRIGRFLQTLRKEKNMTQKELAEKLGVTDRAISKWENGRGMPDVSLMKPLCDLLGITVNELLSGERIREEEFQEKSEFTFLSTIGYTDKKIKEKNLFLRIVAIIAAVAVVTVLLLMDARVFTRPFFSPKEELEIDSVRKRLPVAPEGERVSREESNEFIDQYITWKIDIEQLKEVLPMMRVSYFPISLHSYWMGDNTYEIFGYIKNGRREGQAFTILLGEADGNYLQWYGNRRYYIKDAEGWMEILELLEGWDKDYRENFQWEADRSLAIFYQGKLHSGMGTRRKIPQDAIFINYSIDVVEIPNSELETNFGSQGMPVYTWEEDGIAYIGVQVDYHYAYALPIL